MKKVLCVFLCFALLAATAGCAMFGGSEEVDALKARVAELEAMTPTPAEGAAYKVTAVNALVYPEGGDPASAAPELTFTEPTNVVAVPQVPEGKVVQLWDVNGAEIAPVENQALVVAVTESTLVKAVLRDELKVTSINAYMQFLDAHGDPYGDKFKEYVFEYDDENVKNKLITVYVRAEVPDGYTVDYWLINDVPYHFNRTVTSFVVKDLDEVTVYEVVFKKASTHTEAPEPTSAPNETPVPTPTPTRGRQTPTPTTTPRFSFVLPSFSFGLITPTPKPTVPPIG